MSKYFSRGLFYYVAADYLAALLSWVLFFLYRKIYLEFYPFHFTWAELSNSNFLYGVLTVPPFWILTHALFDSYRNIYRMSRLTEFFRTISTLLIGSVIIFFILVLNDIHYYAEGYKSYYYSFFALFGFHFIILSLFRLSILQFAKNQIKKGKISFRTLLIGSSTYATNFHEALQKTNVSNYYNFIGFATVFEKPKSNFKKNLTEFPHLGQIDQLESILDSYDVEEVILALEPTETDVTQNLLNTLAGRDILIKVIPDLYEILLGKVKMNNVYGEVLIEISPQYMPVWFSIIKRLMDIFCSICFLTIFSPLYLFISIKVWLSSKGPIFYKQERIGHLGKPFLILKFRSMYLDSEKTGPQLSTDNDDRCTPWGKIMRKYRLDELPQFWNVLIGDMSLVGPRPERKFYLDQIAQKAPHVRHLLKVRPGITSWGQVKFGYASDVDEMIQRLKYDILYIENISLGLDIKILFYTVVVILQGRGK